jgi:DNA-binding response OmpR family regulator
MEMRILLVEDTDSDIEACLSTVHRYNKQKEYEIVCVVKKSKDEALSALDSSFDGAIIDLKLSAGSDSTEGNDVISDIHSKWRIPIIIFN